jgi:beta-phosphoglucomutase-like phosphatase (HAD superfamily)
MQLILASSASKVTIERDALSCITILQHIVSGEDFPKSKPDPAIFVHAASYPSLPKANCDRGQYKRC